MNRIATDPHWLRTLLLAGANDHRPDAELLDRFARYREQAAFEAILRRHGPLVWGVCRRTLSNPADADDAFQATFLVLVQKAGRIRHGGQLGPWLYGVAVKVARRLRDKARRAPSCDPDLAALLPERERPDPDADWLAHLDRELNGLPAKFRDPMVLCELQGLSRTAAAERLRLREGTLSSRLARGRTLLRQRLLKYGTLLPAGGLATLLGTASTAPARLLGKTAESVAQVTAAGGILTGVVPASVATLTLEATGMGLFKLKIATAMAVTLATLTLGLVAADGPKVPADKPAAEVVKPAAIVAEKPVAIEGDLAALQGVWDVEGVGVPGLHPTNPLLKGRCVVRGDVMWLIASDVTFASRITLRLTPNRNPKWIDLDSGSDHSRFAANGVTGGVAPGIYRVTPDFWELAVNVTRRKFRPAEFETDPESRIEHIRFRRTKFPTSRPEMLPIAAREELYGRWSVLRHSMPSNDRSKMTETGGGVAEITPEYLFVQHPFVGTSFLWYAIDYRLYPDQEPKWIDLAASGSASDASRKRVNGDGFGVYELAGETLRISYRTGVPRVFRTLEFKSGIEEQMTGGDGKPDSVKPACALLELKRVKTP